MQEILEKRTLNSKTFQQGGNLITQFGCGNIHYRDKNTQELKDVKWDLIKNGSGWGFQENSFNPLIPNFSNEWLEFRDVQQDKDQVIRFKAVGNSIQGIEQTNKNTNPLFIDNKKVIFYPDVFGEGIDYAVYCTKSQLVKLAIIREPKKFTKDIILRWEIDLPPERELWRNDEYKIDEDRGKEFDTFKNLIIKTEKGSTFIKPFKAWDSKGKISLIKTRFFKENNKLWLEKIIPLTFLERAEGMVFADTTTSFTPGAGDGHVDMNLFTNWNTSHDAINGDNAAYTGTTFNCLTHSSTNYIISRTFFPFDTSSLPDDANITSATLDLYVASKTNNENDGNDFVRIVQTTQASTAELVIADYDNCGAIDNPTAGAADIDLGNINVTAYNTWTLNATGIGWISLTGWTMLGGRAGHDAVDDIPTAENTTTIQSSEGANAPTLYVTYPSAEVGGFMTLNTKYWG